MVGRVVRKRKAPVRRVIRYVVRRRAPVRRMGMGRRRVMGRGWWDTVKSGLSSAADFVKDNRLLSRGIRMIPGKYSAPLANLASTAGYGRRGPTRRRVGRGFWDTIKSGLNTAADFVKDNRLLSRGIRMIPGKYSAPLANLASAAGYGMRGRRTRRVGGRMMLSPPFMGGRRRAPRRRVGGRVVFPAIYTTGMGGLSATTG